MSGVYRLNRTNNVVGRISQYKKTGALTFNTQWKTDNAGVSNDDQIKLPLLDGYSYDFIVFWGDGNSDHITAWDQAETTHTYASAGTYDVVIDGICYGWRFNNGGDKLKLLNISNWGTGFRLGNAGRYFYGCTNLTITATDMLDTTDTTNWYLAFYNCTSLTTVPSMNSWDMSLATIMYSMFRNTAFNQDISDWDVGSVTDMSYMFRGTIFNQDIGGWDVSSVTTMIDMFRSTPFNQNIGGWDVGLVTNMSYMFLGVTLSTANYDALLIGWEGLSPALQNNVTFHGGFSKYTAGGAAATARQALIDNHNWDITDGGPI